MSKILNDLVFADNASIGINLSFGTTTGTKIGTSTSQKLSFYGVTPVVQQGATTDLKDALTSYGLITGTSASPLNLDGGAVTSGGLTVNGNNSGNVTILPWSGQTAWIDIPAISGFASGIGSGGAGVNPWVAYAGSSGNWFTNASVGDICYRNTTARLRFGGTSSNSQMDISSTAVNIATTGNLGFYGVTAVAQQGATTDLKDALTLYGLITGTSASPLNLDGGTLSAGALSVTSGTTATNSLTFGADSPSVNLYRSATSTLKTDANFIVAGNLSVTGSTTLGSVAFSGFRSIFESRTVPTSTSSSNAINIGTFTLTQGAGVLQISVVIASSTSFSVSKHYIVPVSYNSSGAGWQRLCPISNNCVNTTNDIDLNINVTGTSVALRLVKVAGSASGAVANINIIHEGVIADTYTTSSTVTTITAPVSPTDNYSGTPIEAVANPADATVNGRIAIKKLSISNAGSWGDSHLILTRPDDDPDILVEIAAASDGLIFRNFYPADVQMFSFRDYNDLHIWDLVAGGRNIFGGSSGASDDGIAVVQIGLGDVSLSLRTDGDATIGGTLNVSSNILCYGSVITTEVDTPILSYNGDMTISPQSRSSATGYSILMTGGAVSGGSSNNAGNITITGGSTSSSTSNGGAVVIKGGTGTSTNGAVNIQNSGGTTQIQVNSTGIGFFNTTPVAQQGATTSIETALSNLGLRASGSSAPLAIAQLTIADGSNIVLGTTTGTKFGTGTTQKIGFYNTTPVAQQAQTVDLKTMLVTLGLYASTGGTTPLNLGSGALTVGAITASSITDNISTQKVVVSKAGSTVGTRKQINLIEGTGIGLTIADNSGSDRVDVTVNATAGLSYAITFNSTTDWGSASGGKYTITFTHSLNTNNCAVEIWDETSGKIQTFTGDVTMTSVNAVAISVPQTPDGRFAGRIVILANGSGIGSAAYLGSDNTFTGQNTFTRSNSTTAPIVINNAGAGSVVDFSSGVADMTAYIIGYEQACAFPVTLNGVSVGPNYGNPLSLVAMEQSCFVAGTPILTPHGYSSIEDVKIGDKVISMDEESRFVYENEVTQIYVHKPRADGYLIINEMMKVTRNHKIYINDKWIPIGQAKIGDYLINAHGKKVWVYSIEEVTEGVETYNFKVKEANKNYFAHDLLVHNKCPFLYVFDKGKWIYQNTFIYELDAPEKQTVQRRKLRTLTNEFVVREIEPETSYIKSMALIAITPSGEKRCEWINKIDNFTTKHRDIVKVMFEPLPPDTTELYIEAEGYYIWQGD